MKLKSMAMVVGVVMVASGAGFLSYSHGQYAKRAEAAQSLPSIGTKKTVFRR